MNTLRKKMEKNRKVILLHDYCLFENSSLYATPGKQIQSKVNHSDYKDSSCHPTNKIEVSYY